MPTPAVDFSVVGEITWSQVAFDMRPVNGIGHFGLPAQGIVFKND